MRAIAGLLVLAMMIGRAWHRMSKDPSPGARRELLWSMGKYLTTIAVGLGMAAGVDAGWTHGWARVSQAGYVSVMGFLILFGIFTLVLFLQAPDRTVRGIRRLERNCAVGCFVVAVAAFAMILWDG